MCDLIHSAESQNSILYVKNKYKDELFIDLLEEHISSEIFEVVNGAQPLNLVGSEGKYNCILTPLYKFTTDNYVEKVTHHMDVLDSLTQEFQTLNVEQKQTVDD